MIAEHIPHEVTGKLTTSPDKTNQALAFQKFVYASIDAYINFVFMSFAYYRRVLHIAESVALRAKEEDEEEWVSDEKVESVQESVREWGAAR